MNYITDFKMEYVDLPPGRDKYVNRDEFDIMDAVYSRVPGEENPDICALPLSLSTREMITLCANAYIAPNRAFVEKMTKAERLRGLSAMKDKVRFYMSWYSDLQERVFECLWSAYSRRRLGYKNNSKDDSSKVISVAPYISGSVQSMSLIGTAGSGKSSAMELILSIIPKAIRHQCRGFQYIQIPVITTTIGTGKDVKALFINIAKQIDQILGFDLLYADSMTKQSNIAKMQSFCMDLIRIFHVGMIVIDEVQLGVNNVVFEVLLDVTASTGVAICLVGTEEAVKPLNQNLWFSRRFSQMGRITSDILTPAGAEEIRTIVTMLWTHQWTVEQYPLTQEIIDALIEESGNNIDYLTTLFVMAQASVIMGEKKQKRRLDAEQIHKEASKFPFARKLIHDGQEVSDQYQLEKKKALDGVKNEANRLENDTVTRIEGIKVFSDQANLISDIVYRVQCLEDYSERQIKHAYDILVNEGTDFQSMDARQRAKMIFAWLTEHENQKTMSQKKKEPVQKKTKSNTKLDNMITEFVNQEQAGKESTENVTTYIPTTNVG